MRYLIILALAALLAGLNGCATMNEQACLSTDWRSVGFEDGVAGRSAGNIGSYRSACSKHGVTPDLAEYRAGHDEGVLLYCRANNGFEVGRRGGQYFGVCPADLEAPFLDAYADGRQLYELQATLRSIDNQIAARHKRLAQLRDDLVVAGAEIIADDTSATRRAELVINIAAMSKEQVKVAAEIEDLEAERLLSEADLLAYRQTLAYAF